MLSLATSRSKKPSAQPPDPNIRLGFGETALRRSLFFCALWTGKVAMMTPPAVGLEIAEDHRCR
jgi:hypothetical protein